VEGFYNSLDRYTLRVLDKATHQPAVALAMRRNGLVWRLTAIQLPPDETTKD